MKKLPTVKIGGKTSFVIDRTHIEDDIAAAEAISRDAARWRWLKENWDTEDCEEFCSLDMSGMDKFVDERI